MTRVSAALQSVLVLATTQIGCGLMLNGKYQDVHLVISPPGAAVSVYRWDGTRIAGPQDASNGTMEVHRPKWAGPYLFMASKEGYCPKYWLTGSTESFGSYVDYVLIVGSLLGGLIAAAVDSTTGAGWQIEPSTVAGSLESGAECVR
jgi:hypothetical protein